MKEPKVTLIDYTGAGTPDPARHAANVLVFTKQTRLEMEPDLFAKIEGWSAAKIAEELEYISNTLPSSWEFVEYKFLINNVTRAFTHQLVRTRTGSYAQQAMRVVDVREGFNYRTEEGICADEYSKLAYDEAMTRIKEAYADLIERGMKVEDARGLLPTNILTNIVAKFNLRSLAETARKRSSSRVQGEYRSVVEQIKAEILRVHPWVDPFINRKFDALAVELETAINALGSEVDKVKIANMVKLIDQLRATA